MTIMLATIRPDEKNHPAPSLAYAGLQDKDESMGTAEVQGELWGAKAKDWAEANEPAWIPVYRSVLTQADVGKGTRLLDVGCGAGGALILAHQLGAEVAGLDASKNLVQLGQSRLPSASIKVGEMEELPFGDDEFDVVMGINSFQFAGDIRQALREARRVCKPEGNVTMLVWGQKEGCELMTTVLPPVFALLPPSPPGGPAPLALSEPGVIESLMQEMGLSPSQSSDLDCPLVFPNRATASRAILSAMARAISHAGEEAVRHAVAEGLSRVQMAAGHVELKSRFRVVTAHLKSA